MCSLFLTLSFRETASDDERIGTWASICFNKSWADWSIEINTVSFSFFLSAFYREVSGWFIDSRFSRENSNGRQSVRDLCDGFEALLKSLVAFLGNFEAKEFWLQRFTRWKGKASKELSTWKPSDCVTAIETTCRMPWRLCQRGQNPPLNESNNGFIKVPALWMQPIQVRLSHRLIAGPILQSTKTYLMTSSCFKCICLPECLPNGLIAVNECQPLCSSAIKHNLL